MSNQWSKRQRERLTCPSGATATCRRLGPEMVLIFGKIQRILGPLMETTGSVEERGLSWLDKASDPEVEEVYSMARVVVAKAVEDPKLYLKPGPNQLSPDDLPGADFWFIYAWASKLSPDTPVELEEGETTVGAVETFPEGQASEIVSGNNEQPVQSLAG